MTSLNVKATRNIAAFLCLCAGFGTCGEVPAAQELAYGSEAPEWTLPPELAAEVRQLAAEDRYRPHLEHTRLFVRTQLKYGLERDDYLHKWYDRPLMQDSTFQSANEKGQFINAESWLRQAAMGRLCGHGFSAFTITGGRDNIIPRSVMPGGEVPVLVEILGNCAFEGGEKPNLEKSLARIDEALKMPNAFRIGGRTVITSYPMIRMGDKSMVFYRALKAELVRTYGDRVALMPYFTPFPLEYGRPYDRPAWEKIKADLRTVLREMDGLCLETLSILDWNRRTNPKFAVEVAAPLIHSVLSEPAFKDKFFGVVAHHGHENCYRWNYAKDCTGTRAFRDCYAAIRALRPDFINACEWDEENENTHYRPTVATGLTTQRLLRYATATFDGREPPVWPGDDTSVPNLILSYRKSLLAGEPIEAEVLNIPDGTFKGEGFTVQLAWRNLAGEIVQTYPPQRLSADELKAAWFVSPSIDLLEEPVLRPELTVGHAGKTTVFAEGFWPLSLHANRTVEFRWVKQPLRDRAVGTTGTLVLGAPGADGTVEVSGEVTSAEELRSVEVLDGPDTVYLHDPAMPSRDADGSLSVRIAWQGLPCNKSETPSGTIRLVGAPGAAISALKPKEAAEWAKLRNVTVKDHEITFRKAKVKQWVADLYADIPAAEVETAAFEVDIPPYFTGRVKAKDLVRDDIFSFPAAGGMNLVFRRWLAARNLTPPCGGKKVKFSFRMKPSTPDSVLRLQTIDAKFRVSRCAVHSFFRPSGRQVSVAAFDREAETVGAKTVDANRAYGFDYRFSPARGGVVTSGAGLGADGILCGFTPLVCGYGSAESGGGNLMVELRMSANAPGWPDTVPKYVREPDGRWSLAFTNCSFVTLPQQIVPIYAGFTLEMVLNPNEVVRRQGLFSTGPAYFNLYLEKGQAVAELFLRNGYYRQDMRAQHIVRGPAVKPGVWQKIRVVYDRKTVRIDVDGERGVPAAVAGDFFYARHSALGALGRGDTFYNGRMKSLKVMPTVAEEEGL